MYTQGMCALMHKKNKPVWIKGQGHTTTNFKENNLKNEIREKTHSQAVKQGFKMNTPSQRSKIEPLKVASP